MGGTSSVPDSPPIPCPRNFLPTRSTRSRMHPRWEGRLVCYCGFLILTGSYPRQFFEVATKLALIIESCTESHFRDSDSRAKELPAPVHANLLQVCVRRKAHFR